MTQANSYPYKLIPTATVLRLIWLLVMLATIGIIGVAVPLRYQMLLTDPHNYAADLYAVGRSLSFYATTITLLELVTPVASIVVASLIVWKRSDQPFALFVALTLTMFGLLPPLVEGISFANPRFAPAVVLIRMIELDCLMAVFCLFPNGRFTPRWTRWLLIGWVLFFAGVLLYDPVIMSGTAVIPQTTTSNDALWLLVGVGWFTLPLIGQVIRYRDHANPQEKQQMKWILLAFILTVFFSLINALAVLFIPNEMTNPLLGVLITSVLSLASALLLPASFALSMLRYRLWDVDILLNRTLVYGGLTAVILLIYALLVGGLSLLWYSPNNLLVSLFTTGLIAVLFQPMRERLQQSANRLIFGERDDPYAVLSQLGKRLQKTAAPSDTLHAITATICHALKLPYAAIQIQTPDGLRQTVATSGREVDTLVEWPLRYHGEAIGFLRAAPRSPYEQFTPKEHQLLANIATQVGAIAYGVRLTNALQRSREKLVLAREEERRRIRRDLHDELGPTLASQTFKLDAALSLLENNPAATADLLQNIKQQNKTLVAEIRQLVYALRPPTLDELGLVGTLQNHIDQLNGRASTMITLHLDPPQCTTLSAAVEVAAYRIVLEGLNNILRHAKATHCTVTLTQTARQLIITIADYGQGLPAELTYGVGLTSMQERVDELGGHLQISPNQPQGTVITAVLPVSTLEQL